MNPDALVEASQNQPEKKWFRRPWFKILTFVLLMPVWAVIIWTDPDEKRPMKVFAAAMLVLAICAGILNDRHRKAQEQRWEEMESKAAEQADGHVR